MSDMIWDSKTCKSKYKCKRDVKSSEKISSDPDGSCLKYLDIGDPKSNKKGFSGADDIRLV